MNQHTGASRFVLENFEDTRTGKIGVYDSEKNGECFQLAAENAGVYKNFYSFKNENGTWNHSIEEAMANMVETPAHNVYQKKLLNGVIPTGQEKYDFGCFIALQQVRTTAARESFGQGYSQFLQVALRMKLQMQSEESLIKEMPHVDKDLLLKSRDQILKEGLKDYEITIPKEYTFGCLQQMEGLSNLLYQKKWSFIKPKHGFFITSDNPVVECTDPRTHHPLFGTGGFSNRTHSILYPLNPHLILRMSWEEKDEVFYASREFADYFNQTMAAQSERFIFSHLSNHKGLKKLSNQYKNCKSRLLVGGPSPKTFAKTKIGR